MTSLISAIWNALEILCYFLLFAAFLKQKRNTVGTIMTFLVTWVFFLLSININIIKGLDQVGPICIAVVASFFLYKGKWYHHIFAALLCYILFAIVDTAIAYGVSILRGTSFSQLIWQKNTYLTAVTIAKLLEVLLAWLIFRIRSTHSLEATKGNWVILTLLFPVASVIMLVVIFYSFQDSPDLSVGAVIFSIVLGVANVAILYIIHAIEKATQQEREMDLLKQQISLQANNYESLENNYRLQRQSVHEFERHLQVLTNLIETEEMETAEKYLKQLKANRSLRVFSVNSHHPVIDVILNQKYQLAQDQNIHMHIQVNDLSMVSIQTDFLVVVLSNLLDNAIEACMHVPENRQIFCRLLVDESFYLTIRNTSNPISIENGIIETTKDNCHEHGYGIPAVRYILDNMSAEYTFDYQNGWFQFVAELPLK